MKLNQKGFSLPQLLISAGIMGGMGLIVSQIMTSSQTSSKKSAVDQEINLITSQMQNALSDRATCSYTLKNHLLLNQKIIRKASADKLHLNADPIPFNGPPLFQADSVNPLGSSGILLTDIVLENTNGSNFVKVVFDVTKAEGTLFPRTVERKIAINRDSTTSDSCNSERNDTHSQVTQEGCVVMGATWIGGICKFNNLPQCMTVENASECAMPYSLTSEILVGYPASPFPKVKKIYKCCRDTIPAAPVILPPNEPTCDPSDPNGCESCLPDGSNCPMCGPADGLPYYGPWSACDPVTRTQSRECITSDPTMNCSACGAATMSCSIVAQTSTGSPGGGSGTPSGTTDGTTSGATDGTTAGNTDGSTGGTGTTTAGDQGGSSGTTTGPNTTGPATLTCADLVTADGSTSDVRAARSLGCDYVCFVAGTQITLWNDHYKAIEDILVGEKLIDGQNNNVSVLELKRHNYKGLIYGINGGRYFFTPNHPFRSFIGWKAIDAKWAKLALPNLDITPMKVGDILMKKDGMEVIFTLDSIYVEETVYNFEVSNSHEYIANDYFVHNKITQECWDQYQGNCPR